MRDYDRMVGDGHRADCAGMLRLDPDATDPLSPMALAVCDECNFEVAVDRAAHDPEWRGRFLLERSGLPDQFRDKPFGRRDEHNGLAIDASGRWLENMHTNRAPAFHGPAGVGKTHLLTRTGVRLCQHGIRVIYRDYVSLLKAERAYMDRPTGPRPLEECAEVEILVLDDVGAERSTPWSQEQLQWLIDERYKAGRPMLCATNVDVVEWPEAFGERAASRLAAMTEPILMGGPDLRLLEGGDNR